ncbi:MAG: hypothetical protein WAM14_24445 [Candidatus Nitrosopolaris sp.]
MASISSRDPWRLSHVFLFREGVPHMPLFLLLRSLTGISLDAPTYQYQTRIETLSLCLAISPSIHSKRYPYRPAVAPREDKTSIEISRQTRDRLDAIGKRGE